MMENNAATDNTRPAEATPIVNHNTNCQVFNGPVSGCIFAMPGSHVEQHPVQQVTPGGETHNTNQQPRANDDRLLVPLPDNLPEAILKAPAQTMRWADNPLVIRTLQDAGQSCKKPEDLACLMAVCADHGLLADRTNLTGFARTLVAWGIVPLTTPETVHRLANSLRHTMEKLPPRYRQWPQELKRYRDKCQLLATHFGSTMPYRYT